MQGHVFGAGGVIVAHDELVQLRWLRRGGREHPVDLSAMVGLVLEEVGQHVVAAVVLDPWATVDGDDLGQRPGRLVFDMGQEG